MVLPINFGRKSDGPPLNSLERLLEAVQRFGVVTRVLRMSKNISQEELAKCAGIPLEYLLELEEMSLSVADVTRGVVVRISRALDEKPGSIAIRSQFELNDLPRVARRVDLRNLPRLRRTNAK